MRGGFDFDKLKPIFLVFFLSMLVSMFSALRAASNPRLASVGTLMLALVPSLSTRWAAGAYADMPQAAMLAGVVAACLNPGDSALPWLIGGLTAVKAEGTILAALACAGILLFWLLEGPRGFLARVRREAGSIAIVACLVGLRLAYLRWSQYADDVYGSFDAAHLRLAIGRIPHVARLCVERARALPPMGAALAGVSRGGDRADRARRRSGEIAGDRDLARRDGARRALSVHHVAPGASRRAGVLSTARAACARGRRGDRARLRARSRH